MVELADTLDLGAVTTLKVFAQLKIESGKLKVMDSILEQKSFRFAIRIVNLCKHLLSTKKEYTLSKQLLRCGTSIGANLAEAQQAQSKADFISKLSIALKETTETKYWKMLVASVKTSKEK